MNRIKIPIYIYLFLATVLCIIIFPYELFSKKSIKSENEASERVIIPNSINKTISNEAFLFPETESFDKYIKWFIQRWDIKGASLAIMKDGKIVYCKGYGWANKEDSISMDAGNILRVASLSKLITATAIMKLREDNKLSLSDKVFGEDGILNDAIFDEIKDKRARQITVEHLLRHRGGFGLQRGDPLFSIRDIMIWEDMEEVPDTDGIIQYALSQRLNYTPGTGTKYSNLGYLILSKIIEVKSGLPYEEYCQKYILEEAGVYDMHLAKNLYKDRYINEVKYYETYDAEPIPVFDKNIADTLYRSYGGNNIEGLYGAGGWVSSPVEFLKFIHSINNMDDDTDILYSSSINKMKSNASNLLPIGWVRASNNGDWLRTGSLAGSSAVAKNQRNGISWVFITNTSSWKGSGFTRYIESMMRKALGKIKLDELPEYNYIADTKEKTE